jgi:hypothetical protein
VLAKRSLSMSLPPSATAPTMLDRREEKPRPLEDWRLLRQAVGADQCCWLDEAREYAS